MQLYNTHVVNTCLKFKNDLTSFNGDMSSFICARLQVLLSVPQVSNTFLFHFSKKNPLPGLKFTICLSK